MEIKDLIQESYDTAKEKGWEDPPRTRENIPELLMLIVTEVAEGMEEYRNNNYDLYYYNEDKSKTYDLTCLYQDIIPHWKPEGLASELADVIIRICNMSASLNIPLEKALAAKLAYNKTRPYRHGNKRC